MPLSVIVTPSYNFSDGEKVTYPKLNLLGSPSVQFSGELSSAQLSDGSVVTSKLEQGININSKIDDHNLNLTKLEAGTQGQILYYNADGDLVKLAPGSDGQFLKTKGAGANPEWSAQDGTDTINISQIVTDGANKFISSDSSGNIQWEAKSSLSISVADLWEQQSQGVDAGASDTTDQTRNLNQSSDPDGIIVSLSSGQFTLAAGTYSVIARVPGYDSGNFTSWLYNFSDSSTTLNGTSIYFGSSDTETLWSTISGVFTIADQKTFEIRFKSKLSQSSNGLGRAADITGHPEIYSQLKVTKLA